MPQPFRQILDMLLTPQLKPAAAEEENTVKDRYKEVDNITNLKSVPVKIKRHTLLQHLIGGTKASMRKDDGTTIKQSFPPIC